VKDADAIWDRVALCIQRSAKEVLGISRGGRGRIRGAWWWNDEVKEKIKEKQNAYAAISNSTSEEERGVWEAKYKAAKQLPKKAITIVKNNSYERLYQRLENKEGEKDVLARVREKRTRGLGNVRCIKGEDGQVLGEETKIRERW